jgi:hypothetical protein
MPNIVLFAFAFVFLMIAAIFSNPAPTPPQPQPFYARVHFGWLGLACWVLTYLIGSFHGVR